MPFSKRRSSSGSKGGRDASDLPGIAESATAAASTEKNGHDLILTSEKRRGIFECDYCHDDISQMPRIRCAVCVDFDLCLSCFVSTQRHPVLGSHDASKHGYRVCESTRYPIFPSKVMIENSKPGSAGNPTSSVAPSSLFSGGNNTSSKDPETGNENDARLQAKDDQPQSGDAPSSTKEEAKDKGEESKKTETKSTESKSLYTVLPEDPKMVWTAEEDLRLLEGIRAHGLGNWVEISEAVSGQGSVGKTPRRCSERYFDDFLGRYGHIVPPYILLPDDDEDASKQNSADGNEPSRASKRTIAMMRSPTSGGRKRLKMIKSESTKGYENVWPKPYLPPTGAKLGQEVGRDTAYKAEQQYVKTITAIEKKEDVEKVRKEWAETRLLKPNGPTVLPPRPDDATTMPGAELVGFMPRREDFDIEWENEAEQAVADMEFVAGESEEDRALKLQVLGIYNSKLDEREQRKKFIISRKLYAYREIQSAHKKLPQDERDLIHRMRLFERFHTPEEHNIFIADLLKAKKLRKDIAKLQMYRRIGIRTLAEAEKYDIDKSRRRFHKAAHAARGPTDTTQSKSDGLSASESSKRETSTDGDTSGSSSLWKTYRTGDRRVRKSINRGSPSSLTDTSKDSPGKKDNINSEESPSKVPMDVEETVKTPSNAYVESTSTSGSKPSCPVPLSRGEVELCGKLKLVPNLYVEIKKAIIYESLQQGLLDKEGPGSNKRTLVQIDAKRRDGVIDFCVRAGWISTKRAKIVRASKPALIDPDGELDVPGTSKQDTAVGAEKDI